MPIQVLPPSVAAKIAAGEVVERPASVVKELVENALDAGATRIGVELKGGGLDLVRVTDNGCGIPARDTKLLFQRHATSKLETADGLEGVRTLGFRGEALYSVAAMASVGILTRAAGEDAGTYLETQQGRVHRQEPRGAPQGTTITVQRLFSDFPARRKFLRSPQTEAGRVQTLMGLYLIAYPEVAFTLTSDDKEALASAGNGSMREAAASVHGHAMATALLEIHAPQQTDGLAERLITVSGLISPPSQHRANRSGIVLFVNRRPVQSRSLLAAVDQAYLGVLPQGRHPNAVLNVTVPLADVDVNVHPTKSEVRFRDEQSVFSAVQRTVRATLVAHAPIPFLTPEDAVAHSAGTAAEAPTATSTDALRRAADQGALFTSPAQAPTGQVTPTTPRLHKDALPVLRVLGQMQETYVVAEGPEGMYLVDQHAAHERVQYERLRASSERSGADVQGLLAPQPVELTPQQVESMGQMRQILARYGWQLEGFGGRTVLVRAMPAMLSGKGPEPALKELLDSTMAETALPTIEERLAATTACHGSVRAGQTLSQAEMAELLQKLYACREPQTCPHGRPTVLHLSAAHLAQEFRRR
ncbi:MAG: DNA mismatch repair endonuclease MutL [Dehalococcoidia bacterium]|nr:DNA mismatch repair endonuclease MutL [Dehalococcoidia bacterium]